VIVVDRFNENITSNNITEVDLEVRQTTA